MAPKKGWNWDKVTGYYGLYPCVYVCPVDLGLFVKVFMIMYVHLFRGTIGLNVKILSICGYEVWRYKYKVNLKKEVADVKGV